VWREKVKKEKRHQNGDGREERFMQGERGLGYFYDFVLTNDTFFIFNPFKWEECAVGSFL
jgi:hypothetical protein